jgi:hypothetical protein
VRIAAASAARHLSTDQSNPLLLQLVDDADGGVRKVARRSASDAMSDALRARVVATERADRMPAPRTAAARPARRRAKKAAGQATRKTRAAAGAKKKRRPAGRAAKKARQRR